MITENKDPGYRISVMEGDLRKAYKDNGFYWKINDVLVVINLKKYIQSDLLFGLYNISTKTLFALPSWSNIGNVKQSTNPLVKRRMLIEKQLFYFKHNEKK